VLLVVHHSSPGVFAAPVHELSIWWAMANIDGRLRKP
jgi:hypothetical protein